MRSVSRSPGSVVAAALLLILLLLMSVAPRGASAFGTVEGFDGQRNEHERITRAALACGGGATMDGRCFDFLTIDFLAGKNAQWYIPSSFQTPGFGAVGAPDKPNTEGEIEDHSAHCDNADFLDLPDYPQLRLEATAMLAQCIAHARARLVAAVEAARRLVKPDRDVIDRGEVALLSIPLYGCDFPQRPNGPAKCRVLNGFGRALHTVQDFYSHSNWVDRADPTRPIGFQNPPGLGQAGIAPFLDLRRTGFSFAEVPRDLTTGCSSIVPGGCKGRRVTHTVLNKDRGLIDPYSAEASDPITERGRIADNFQRAVDAAIGETRRQWEDLRATLKLTYGDRRGNLMVCALIWDDPIRECQGRDLAVVIDSSTSNVRNDPENLRLAAASAFIQSLTSSAEAGSEGRPDRVAVVEFDTEARVVSPLGDPAAASVAGIDSSGGTLIGTGVALALDVLRKDSDRLKDHAGIVVLTDGEDNDPTPLVAALNEAARLGVRVSFGFLAPPNRAGDGGGWARRRATRAASGYVDSIRSTGGVFAAITSARAQRTFIDLLQSNGATNRDDPNGRADDSLILRPGLEFLASVTPSEPDRFFHPPRPERLLHFTITTGAVELKATVRDVRTGAVLASPTSSSFWVRGRPVAPLELVIVARRGQGDYTVRLEESGKTLRGTSGSDILACPGEPTYVTGGEGDDVIRCGAAADLIVPGRGVDRVAAGAGDDVILIRRRDLVLGHERISGDGGRDRLEFSFPKPPSVRCVPIPERILRIARRVYLSLDGVEVVTFGGERC